MYDKLLAQINVIIAPKESDQCKHIYHIYAIRVGNRDSLIAILREKNIYCGIHYPVPIHLQKAYQFFGVEEGSFLITERCSNEFISLPMFAELTNNQIEYVISEINVLKDNSRR